MTTLLGWCALAYIVCVVICVIYATWAEEEDER